jgi:hypothetical protein
LDEAIRALAELSQSADTTHEQLSRFIKTCERLQVPKVRLYFPYGSTGYRMVGAYVLTHRKDAHAFVWYYSPYQGVLYVCAIDGDEVPFEDWDPDARFFTHACLDEGGLTFQSPLETERRMRERE